MLLTEVFNAPYSWKWTTNTPTHVKASFVDRTNHPYVFIGDTRDIAPLDQVEELICWDIDFARVEKTNDGSFTHDWSITNTGDQQRIFATVVDIIKHLIIEHKPQALFFSARERTRMKLYKRMVQTLLPDWKVEYDMGSIAVYHPSVYHRLEQ